LDPRAEPPAPEVAAAVSPTGAVEPGFAETSCVACEFVERSVERLVFFLFAESLGESWCIEKMRRGGFCLRHARRLSAGGRGRRLEYQYQEVIRGWEHRSRDAARPDFSVGRACPVCVTEDWADDYTTHRLAEPELGPVRRDLGRVEPLCLHHVDRLIDTIAWSRIGEIGGRIKRRLQDLDLARAPAIGLTLEILCGRDRAGVARQPTDHVSVPSAAASHPPSWAGGSLSLEGLVAQLDAGRCPVCSAARAASWRVLDWLATPDLPPDRSRDLERLCPEHLRDAHACAPLAASRVLASAVPRWRQMGRLLANADVPPPELAKRLQRAPAFLAAHRSVPLQANRLRALKATARYVSEPGALAAERLRLARYGRERGCLACEAMVTATRRTLELLGAMLSGRAGIDRFERSKGLCLRHVAAARRLDASSAGTIAMVAYGRAALVTWELQEALRKSSWSVRYEPAGLERTAWQRALTFVLGDDVLVTDLMAVEPDVPRSAA
jgi:hypothetical protein